VVVGLTYLLVLGMTAIVVHGFYVHIAASAPGKHRMVGHARRLLGPGAGWVVSVTNTVSFFGALLAYIILSGSFLSTFFGGTPFFWSLVFFLGMALLLALPFRRVERFEAFLTWLLLGVAFIIVILASRHVTLANLTAVHPAYWFLPFGVVFFSLGGASAVPDIVESLKKNHHQSVFASTAGTVIAMVVTAAFGIAIAGASGSATSPEAIAGLVPLIGRSIIALGAGFGFLAVATSFIVIGDNLKEQLTLDLKFPPKLAWVVSLVVPFGAYLIGARSFIGVIGFIGAIFGVIDGIIIILMAHTLKTVRLRWTMPLIILLFVLGFISEIVTLTR
jgi:amino acid permease